MNKVKSIYAFINNAKVCKLIKSLDPVIYTEEFKKDLFKNGNEELIRLFFCYTKISLSNEWMRRMTFNFVEEMKVRESICSYGVTSIISLEEFAMLETYLTLSAKNSRSIGSTAYLGGGSISFSFSVRFFDFNRKRNNSFSSFKKNCPEVAQKIKFPTRPQKKVFQIAVLYFNDRIAIAIE